MFSTRLTHQPSKELVISFGGFWTQIRSGKPVSAFCLQRGPTSEWFFLFHSAITRWSRMSPQAPWIERLRMARHRPPQPTHNYDPPHTRLGRELDEGA